MLAAITPLIARGVIDNTLQDLIDLRLWCTDGAEPLHLRMRGNCLRDLAGCRLEFTHTAAGSPPAEMPALIAELRRSAGTAIIAAGDITGAVCLIQPESGTVPSEGDVRLAQVAAAFLGKQMEE